eukprot:14949583-Alexandrium_andersonii.AAC.1
MLMVLGQDWTLRTVKFSPSALGVPADRWRAYTIAAPNESPFAAGIHTIDHDMIERIMARRIELSPSTYLRCTSEQLD